MELITKESETKSRTDKIAQIQHSIGSDSLVIYFNISREISGEKLDENLDSGMPLMVPVELIAEPLQLIYQKALELRANQLEDALAANAVIVIEPNYKGFYGELLATELFAITRQKASEDLQVNTAYTDFALALTNAIVGNENVIALQICLNKMIEVLGTNVQSIQIETLDILMKKHNLPIFRESTTIGS